MLLYSCAARGRFFRVIQLLSLQGWNSDRLRIATAQLCHTSATASATKSLFGQGTWCRQHAATMAMREAQLRYWCEQFGSSRELYISALETTLGTRIVEIQHDG